MTQIIQAITPPFQHLELVVQAFHEAAGVAVDEVMGDFGPPAIQRVQEMIKAVQATIADTHQPGTDLLLGLGSWEGLLENGRQLFAQDVSGVQFRRIGKQAGQTHLVFRRQVGRVLAEGPQAAFELLIFGVGQFEFRPVISTKVARLAHVCHIRRSRTKCVVFCRWKKGMGNDS